MAKQVFSVANLTLWTLKLDGDVHDEAGKANRLLASRVVDRAQSVGVSLTEKQVVANLSNIQRQGNVEREMEGTGSTTQTFSIRLANPDIDKPNPFDDTLTFVPPTPKTIAVVDDVDKQVAQVLAELQTWSLSKRIAVVAGLATSLERDMGAFRDVVMEGL